MNWLQNLVIVTICFLMARIVIDADIHRYILGKLLKKPQSSTSSLISSALVGAYGFSLFFPNTIVLLSMIPLARLVLRRVEITGNAGAKRTFTTHLILALMYGANIGGMGSLTGSPLNIMYLGILEIQQVPGRENITFFSWLLLGVPATLVLLMIGRLVLKIGEKRIPLGNDVSVAVAPVGRETLRKYSIFFVCNLALLMLLAAWQFIGHPRKWSWGLNVVDMLFLIHLALFLFTAFIYPRGGGESRGIKYKKNILFLILFLIFTPFIFVVETTRELVNRFRLSGSRWVGKLDAGLHSVLNRLWSLFFGEKIGNLRTRNRNALVSVNGLIYDLPFFGLVFMGLVIVFIYLIMTVGDNPATPRLDGYVIQFLEALSDRIIPRGDQLFPFLLAIVMISIFLTEVVNNTTIVLILTPVIFNISTSAGVNPMYLLLAVTIAASGAFMTPVATPVNAVAFASVEGVSLKKMISRGIVLNLLSGLWITLVFYIFSRFLV